MRKSIRTVMQQTATNNIAHMLRKSDQLSL